MRFFCLLMCISRSDSTIFTLSITTLHLPPSHFRPGSNSHFGVSGGLSTNYN